MGIFSNNFTTNSGVNIPVIEGYTFDNYGHYDIFMESLEDDQFILESMYIYDMNNIETSRAVAEAAENGEYDEHEARANRQYVMEASAKEFFSRIKAAIKKFFGKVLSWFKSIIDRVRSLGMDAEKFVNTYGARIKKARVGDGIKVSTYKWDTNELFKKEDVDVVETKIKSDDIVGVINRVFSSNMTEDQLDNAIEEAKENNTTTKVLASILGMSGDPSDEEINTHLSEMYRGKDGKSEQTIRSVTKYIDELKQVKGVINSLNKAKEKTTKMTNELIKAYDKAEDKVAGEHDGDELLSKKMSYARTNVQLYKAYESAVIKMSNAHIAALNEYVSFVKGVCLKAIKGVKA